MYEGVFMKVAVVGASGKSGKLIVQECVNAGFDVTAISRNVQDTVAQHSFNKDVMNLQKADLEGFDVIVDALGFWSEDTLPLHEKSLMHLCDCLNGSSTRLLVVGGAGSLYVDSTHTTRVMDTPEFPEMYKPVASNMAKGLDAIRKVDKVNWTYISPALIFNPEGNKTNSFFIFGEELNLDAKGESNISYADFALAVVDIIKSNKYPQSRISVRS